MSQVTLQGWLHLHLAELGDGKVQVLQRLCLLSVMVLQEQLPELDSNQRPSG
jgi:hypothetical protein